MLLTWLVMMYANVGQIPPVDRLQVFFDVGQEAVWDYVLMRAATTWDMERSGHELRRRTALSSQVQVVVFSQDRRGALWAEIRLQGSVLTAREFSLTDRAAAQLNIWLWLKSTLQRLGEPVVQTPTSEGSSVGEPAFRQKRSNFSVLAQLMREGGDLGSFGPQIEWTPPVSELFFLGMRVGYRYGFSGAPLTLHRWPLTAALGLRVPNSLLSFQPEFQVGLDLKAARAQTQTRWLWGAHMGPALRVVASSQEGRAGFTTCLVMLAQPRRQRYVLKNEVLKESAWSVGILAGVQLP